MVGLPTAISVLGKRIHYVWLRNKLVIKSSLFDKLHLYALTSYGRISPTLRSVYYRVINHNRK